MKTIHSKYNNVFVKSACVRVCVCVCVCVCVSVCAKWAHAHVDRSYVVTCVRIHDDDPCL